MGGTGATHAAGAREALSVPSMTDMGQSYAQANSARDQANTARSDANTTFATINTSFGTINTNATNINSNAVNAYAQANGAYDQANAAYLQANIALISANQANVIAKDAYSQANTARTTANDAYATANTKLGTSGGSISGDLTISGNLVVQGNATTINVSNLSVNDSIILLSSNSSGDAEDIGFVGHITRDSTNTHVGLIRKATENRFYLFDNYEVEPTNNTIDITGNNFRVGNIRLGIINANSFVTAAGLDVTGQANAAYSQANSAYGAANNRVLKAGDTMTGQLNISSGGLLVTGSVGIGTTNPTTNLQVVGDMRVGAASTGGSTAGNLYVAGNRLWRWIAGYSPDYGVGDGFGLYDDTGGAYRWMVDTSGNIGIGTLAPIGKLHVSSGTSGNAIVVIEADTDNDNENDNPKLWFRADGGLNEAAIQKGDNTLDIISNVVTGGGINFLTGNTSISGTTDPITNATSRMFITSSGNVGVGLTNPYARLHVTGGAIGQSTTDFAVNSAGTVVFMRTGASTGNTYGLIQAANTGDTVGTNLVLNQFGGNVGIGTESPSEKLTIQNGRIYANISGSDRPAIFESDTIRSTLVLRNSTANTNEVRVGSNGHNLVLIANTEGLILTPTGNVGIGTTSPTAKLDVFQSGSFNTTTPGLTRYGIHLTPQNATVDTAVGITFGAGDSSSGNTADAGIYSQFSGSYGTKLYFATTNDYGAGSKTRMMIDHNGNVGIGTTAPSGKQHNYISSRSTAFSASDGATWHDLIIQNPNNTLNAAVGLVFELNGTYHENAGTGIAAVKSTASSDYGADMVFVTRPQNAVAAERMRITSAGNVGIGTTSPSTKLHLYESGAADVLFRLTSANGTYDPLIQFTGQGNDITAEGFEIWYDNDVGDVHLSTTYPNDAATIHFHTRTGASKSTSNERLTILGNGNVGIGTTSPASKLHVAGTGTFTGQLNTADIISLGYNTNGSVATSARRGIEFHNEGGSDYWIGKRTGAWTQPLDIAFYTGIRYHAHNTYNGHRFFVGGHDSTEAFSVGNGDNHVRVLYNLSVAGTITESSSIALKQNIDPITNALNLVSKLVGVTYDRKDGSAKNRAGLIKEEVEKVLPNIVSDDGIQYTNLIAYLVESIKELKAEIDVLKRQ
jgi:hypothetical protein